LSSLGFVQNHKLKKYEMQKAAVPWHNLSSKIKNNFEPNG